MLAAIEGPTVSNPSFHMRLSRISGHVLLAAAVAGAAAVTGAAQSPAGMGALPARGRSCQ
jgi:hypothetical protein